MNKYDLTIDIEGKQGTGKTILAQELFNYFVDQGKGVRMIDGEIESVFPRHDDSHIVTSNQNISIFIRTKQK